eukprot:PhM_4_TR18652/c0_g1_i1/m.75745/K01476/E3.5.3.1, rocF, arg; arginase
MPPNTLNNSTNFSSQNTRASPTNTPPAPCWGRTTSTLAQQRKSSAPETPLQEFARLEAFLSTTRNVVMFGAPISTGAGYEGLECVVKKMRDKGLEDVIRSNGWHLEDLGDLPMHLTQFRMKGVEDHPKIPNSYAIGRALEQVYDCAYQAARRGAFVLAVGGDRSMSSATVSGILKSRRDMCVIFVGAYADSNTPETTVSGEYRGMTAAHVLGWFQSRVKGFEWLKNFVLEHRCAFIGLRNVDVEEATKMRESGVRIYSMYEVDRYGIGPVMDMAMQAINPHNDRPVHLSFALNALDGSVMPTTGEGGLTYREAHFICETLSRTNLLDSMDIVHVCPAEAYGPNNNNDNSSANFNNTSRSCDSARETSPQQSPQTTSNTNNNYSAVEDGSEATFTSSSAAVAAAPRS